MTRNTINTTSAKNLNPLLFVLTVISMVMPGIPAVSAMTLGDNEMGFADARICRPGVINAPLVLGSSPAENQDELPINLEADEIDVEQGTELVLLTGHAQVVQGNQGLFADEISFDRKTYEVIAQGNVKYYTPNGDEVTADSLQLDVETTIGDASKVQMRLEDDAPKYTTRAHTSFIESYSLFDPIQRPVFESDRQLQRDDEPDKNETAVRARSTAEQVTFEGKHVTRLSQATMSTCPKGNEDVVIHSREIKLNHAVGVGTAKSMKVKFKGIPIFYFPTVTFPINDKRKTGFLFPSVSYEKESGYIVQIPYYINIGPQHDATIIPRVLSHRGNQLYGEYRYLTHQSKGEIKAEILPSDDVYGDERYAIGYKHRHDLGQRWGAAIDYQDVSDSRYFDDFSNEVDVVASSYVQQKAVVDYNSQLLKFTAGVSTFKSVNESVAQSDYPYERLPSLSLDIKPQEVGIFETGLNSRYTRFEHDDRTKVTGTRLNVKPYLQLPMKEVYGYITPRVSVQSIRYSLDHTALGMDDSPTVSVPITSVDSGLIFERLFSRNEINYLQTLEPRLFYVNIPGRNKQERFPKFDSGGGSGSSFSHYFRENRYFGGDVVGDTHQISVGLTSRLIDDDSGEEKFNIKLGQVFFLEDREVGLTTSAPTETTDRSDFLIELGANINPDWNIQGFTRWSEQEKQIGFFEVSAEYDHSRRRNFTIRYTLDEDFANQSQSKKEVVHLGTQMPVAPRWQLEMEAGYSIEESEMTTTGAGITYDGCCWAVKLKTQRYLHDSGIYDNRFILTFSLDDLGRIGSQL